MTATQSGAIAELQRTLAGLLRERDAALSEKAALAEVLAKRNSEFGERIDHQAATLDVLKAMSASPGDPQPVFDLIVRRARNLCNSMMAGLVEYDGRLAHLRSWHGVTPGTMATYERAFPMTPTRETNVCRAILDKHIAHVRDLDADSGFSQAVIDMGHKSAAAAT